MGGKTKQSQRTKNNARPSSSGRSAELLNNVIKTDVIFGTLSTGKVLPAIFPTMAPTSLDHALTNEFTLAFKKLNKKDPITRTKALQELLELINNSDIEEVVAALPNWALFYLMLTIDSERKVREVTQMCHGAIVCRCGRRAAPQLRRLLPAWLLAINDDHVPARETAISYLQTVFPDHKLAEAITFCKSEIMSLIIDNLTGNAETILNKKIEDPDERKIQVSRVISSSLQALELFLEKLLQHDDWVWEQLEPLLNNSGFWKLPVHESHHVRAAWFGAIGRIVERHHTRLSPQLGGKIATALISQPEKRADVAASRWAALLLLLHVQEWHLWLKKKDLLVKRLIDTLENGGWGDATLLTDMLLPLISKLPEDLLTRDFYHNLFTAFFTGLELKNILNSKHERQVWITNIAECLRYLSIQKYDFVMEIVAFAHRSWLERLFTVKDHSTRIHLIKYSSSKMAAIIKYWIKQSTNSTDEMFDKLMRNLWQNFGLTTVSQIENVAPNDVDVEVLAHAHAAMFNSLKVQVKPKKTLRFNDEPDGEVSEPVDELDSPDHGYEHSLRELVSRSCCAYFECAEKKEMSRAVFASLRSVFLDFDSQDLFVNIARHYKLNSIYSLYDNVVRSWLASDTMRCRALAELLFVMSRHFTDDELEQMYDSFQQFSPVAVEWCIALALSGEPRQRGPTTRWLHGVVVEHTLVGLCRRDDSAAAQLVLNCLETHDGEPAVSERTVRAVVTTLTSTLTPQRYPLAAAVCRALARSSLAQAAQPLLFALFDLDLSYLPRDKDAREDGEENDDQTAHAPCALSWGELLEEGPVLGPALVQYAVRAVHQRLLGDEYTLDIPLIEHLVSFCPSLVRADNYVAELKAITLELFKLSIEESESAVRTFALRKDCVYGHLNCPIDDANVQKVIEIANSDKRSELESRDVVLFARALVFRGGFLRNVLKTEDGHYAPDVLIVEEHFERVLQDVLHDAALVNSLCDGYAFAHFYGVLERCKEYLDNVISDIISPLNDDTRRHLAAALMQKARQKGYYWAFADRLFETKLAQIPCITKDDDKTQLTVVDSTKTEDVRPAADLLQQDSNSTSSTFTPVKDVLMLDKIAPWSGFFHSMQAAEQGGGDTLRSRYLVMIRSWYVAHKLSTCELIERRESFVRKLGAGLVHYSLTPVVDDYYQYCEKMFNDRDYSKESWSMISCHSTVLRCLGSLVDARGWDLDSHAWDFINIVLCSVLSSLKCAPHLGSTKTSAVALPALELFVGVVRFVRDVPAESERRQPSAHVADLPAEWRDIFAPTAFTEVTALLVSLLKPSEGYPMTLCDAVLIQSLMDAVSLVNWDQTASEHKQKEHSLEALSSLAFNVMSQDTPYAYKYLAYNALRMIAKPLVLEDVEKLSQLSERREREGDEEEVSIYLSLTRYYEALREHLTHLGEVLEEDSTAEDISPENGTWCTAALGFLLTAQAALLQSELARGDLVHHYINSFGESELISSILQVSLRLLPTSIRMAATAESHAALPERTLALFTSHPPLSVRDADMTSVLGALACRVLYCAVRAAGGAARSYWSSLSARRAAPLRRLVRLAVAPPLINEQLRHLREHNSDLEDAEVLVSRGGRRGGCTVRCVAQLEEREVELTLELSDTHPLEPPRPQPPAHMPLAADQLYWIRVYLAYQNGWVVNALKMWTEMLRSRVQSAAQCYICYCRLHPGTGKLPNVPCYTCNNRFHSQCLRKWFKTSKKSNCPLCRTVF